VETEKAVVIPWGLSLGMLISLLEYSISHKLSHDIAATVVSESHSPSRQKLGAPSELPYMGLMKGTTVHYLVKES